MADITGDTDLELYQGDALSRTFTFADSFDMDGKSFRAVAKDRRGDQAALFSIGLTVSSQVATLTIPSNTSAILPRVCEWEMTDNADATYLSGRIYTRRKT